MNNKNNLKTSILLSKVLLQNTATIQQAIESLNESSIKIVLVTNENGIFEGTISDGDIRRGLLKGLDLNSPLSKIIHRNSLVVPSEMDREMVMRLMTANKIYQIPIVNEQQQVIGLHLWDEITDSQPKRDNLMLIMAGGKGVRLLPHTENCPKPMVLVAGKPMLEHIIERGKLEGFNSFIISVHYLGHVIESYFGNGDRFGVKIDYLREQSPLGTAGALSLLNPRPETSFVVINGDVITDIRYGELLNFHSRYQSVATMAVRLYEWQHPFGVVRMQGVDIIGFEEKPVARSHINAGIYVLSPEVLDELVADTPCDMPLLFELLQAKSKRTVAYPMHEPWLDVGRPDDLVHANSLKM
jgi:dTDP-glucose pyrophosphorylase/predicted transcriptional regulator